MTSEEKYDDLDSTATLIVKGIELINFYVQELVNEYPHKKKSSERTVVFGKIVFRI